MIAFYDKHIIANQNGVTGEAHTSTQLDLHKRSVYRGVLVLNFVLGFDTIFSGIIN